MMTRAFANFPRVFPCAPPHSLPPGPAPAQPQRVRAAQRRRRPFSRKAAGRGRRHPAACTAQGCGERRHRPGGWRAGGWRAGGWRAGEWRA
eukprot:125576-Chlamydomonas_euryale.AAC.2